MMPKSGCIRLVRPSAVIITHKKWVYRVTSYRAAWHFWPIRFSKIAKKQFIEHFFLTRDYNTKSQKSSAPWQCMWSSYTTCQWAYKWKTARQSSAAVLRRRFMNIFTTMFRIRLRTPVSNRRIVRCCFISLWTKAIVFRKQTAYSEQVWQVGLIDMPGHGLQNSLHVIVFEIIV
jgi:hypothetical protein